MRPLDPRVRPHLVPARTPLAVVLAGNVINAGLVIGQAFAVAALVATLIQGGSWETAAWWLAGVTVARAGVGWLVDVAAAHATAAVGTHLRTAALEAALDLPAGELDRRRTGELTALVTRGAGAVEPYLTRYLPALVLAAVLPILTLVAIATLDWWAALVVVATLPLVPVFAILIGLTTAERADRQWRRLSDLAGHFLDVTRGLPTLVAHGRGQAQVPTIRGVTHRYRRATVDTLKLAFASSAALELIATISVALVAVLVGLRLAAGGLDLQTALTVLLLAPEAYWPLRKVGAEYHAAAEGTATFAAIHELTAARPGVGTAAPVPVQHRAPLTLDDVDLAWPGREPVVRGLTATFPARGLTVITGPSGSGKSTLVQALLGELPLASGRVRLGDADLASVSADQWRARVAQVPQRPWHTPGSIEDNLLIGRPDAAREEIWAALRAVRLDGVVAGLPAALDTPLGDEGAGLSAGQRARLALARVVLADRPWVILDEPTAHLDEETEQVLLATLRDLARERAVIVVAHRPALVAAADHEVALDRPASATSLTSAPHRSDHAAQRAPRPHHAPDDVRAPARWRWPLAVALGILASAAGVALTATAGWLIARSAEQPPVMLLTLAIVGVRTFGLARPVLRYAERLASHDVALTWLADRRADLYAALVPLVPARIGRRGDALTGLVDDIDSLLDDRLRVRMPLWTWAGVTTIATAVALFWAPVVALVVLAVALVGVVVFLVARVGTRRAEPDIVAARGALGREAHDALASARQLALWQATDPVTVRLAGHASRQGRAVVRSATAVATARALVVIGCGLGVLLAAFAGDAALGRGDLSGPMAALLVLVPLALADVLLPLADAGALQVRTRAAVRRLDALTAAEPAVSEPWVDPVGEPSEHPHLQLSGAAAGWNDRIVLRDLDLDLPPGTRVGITGPSGSGKSTLAAVLMRFLAVRDGSYAADGIDVDDLALATVRSRIGLIDDDPYVFASTVAENVRLARPGADDTAVEAAIRRAHLGPWLDGLRDGLTTRIGEGGAEVSGGERARLGLARALLADKPVLVLDEPTAHLDTATARAVAQDLLDASDQRSLVWITHDGIGLPAMDAVIELGTTRGASHATR